jgi:hypothetical protein
MVADLEGMEPEEMAQNTTQKALELFGLGLAILWESRATVSYQERQREIPPL